MTKWVYSFGGGSAEGRADMRNLLGGKGANLAEMSNLGLPVPPGFTITTEVCAAFYQNGEQYPDGLKEAVAAALDQVSAAVGRRFGDPAAPLLVSVRSGARASMPGMMDTVLNLGLNDETVAGLAEVTCDDRFAYDSYRRFIHMYSNVVMEAPSHLFEDALDDLKDRSGYALDTEMTAQDLRRLVDRFKEIVAEECGAPFPQDPQAQLWSAIGAVFRSWMLPRARSYRAMYNIPEEWGTAVNVQAMVFGNMCDKSATGVAFTRDPSTGAPVRYGEYLIKAQGEDVVSGVRTPQLLSRAAREASGVAQPSLEEAMPETYAELTTVFDRLETHYRDMQDIEFTVETGKLWLLQTRNGKRTTPAAIRIAVDMAREGLITREEALQRVDPQALNQLLHPTIDPAAPREVIARGLAASPGAASGELVFDADRVEARAKSGIDVILTRIETSPEDIHGMNAAKGILTARGGTTSHAAVVARGMGRACITGAGTLKIDYAARTMTVDGRVYKEGDVVTIDGGVGEVMLGAVATIEPELSAEFETLMEWADQTARMRVRANAETPADAAVARKFGARGIGLCRTEHMFFDAERIRTVREMILATDVAGRRKALERLLPMQRGDFEALFEIMAGTPVTIRLLDPPLHEFLPHKEEDVAAVAAAMEIPVAALRGRLAELAETNPMLGHRGCRLGITYPEIYETQARAIFEAAVATAARTGNPVTPEVMIPLIGSRGELDFLAARVAAVAEAVRAETGAEVDYLIGAMIELPRAALQAADIAKTAQFFSFGTNDLTQTTFGMSRDDSGAFVKIYQERGLLAGDPFGTLDRDGVGELVAIATERGRRTRNDIKLGICGEHGGDPASIAFCEEIGLDYVSCSPFRAPIARLAAAQACLSRTAPAGDEA